MSRDDFSQATKDTLAKRVSYRCSQCGQQTAGPQIDPQKSVSIGVAAHITAASERGPRYDPSLTPIQRAFAENGIWMCQNHGKLVDSDESRYTVDQLRAMKVKAESAALEALEQPIISTWLNEIGGKESRHHGPAAVIGPHLVPVKVGVDARTLIAVGANAPHSFVYCANVLLTNDPGDCHPTAEASSVLGQITFLHQGVSVLTINTARWGDTEQPAIRKAKDPFASLIDLNTVPFRIGETHELNVAIKHPDQAYFYAFDNGTYDHANWENPAFRLEGESYEVVVRLRGVHLDQHYRFNLRNLGAGAGLKFSLDVD